MILETGTPLLDGRYVVYVPGMLDWLEPKLVLRQKGKWTFTFSTEEFPDKVISWMGPLPVLKLEKPKPEERGMETQFPDEPTGPQEFDL